MKQYGEFSSKDEVLDYICDAWDLYEGEGLEKAFETFMKLDPENRTEQKLDNICENMIEADIDIYDDADFIPRV
jgi:hypothetical protein